MELFVVNRYNSDSEVVKPNDEAQLLEKLKLRAEKKRKEKNKLKEDNVIVAETVTKLIENEQEDVEKLPGPMEVEEKQPVEEDIDKPEGYTVLGTKGFEKRQKVDMILPSWLAHPSIISNDLSAQKTPIDQLTYLDEQLRINLKSLGIKSLFPVQAEVIPWIIRAHSKSALFWPRDVCVSAPTGSGKTIAFALPIIQSLLTRIECRIRALIILPVHELAAQVHRVFRKLCSGTKLHVVLLPRPSTDDQQQFSTLMNGKYHSKVDIVISTAGRLVEHIQSTPGFCLRRLQFLVIDEADRVMDQVQDDWLYHLNKHIYGDSDSHMPGRTLPLSLQYLTNEKNRMPHKLLFSATLSQDPEKLQTFSLFQPKLFTSIVPSTDTIKPTPEKTEDNVDNATKETDVVKPKRGEFVGKYTTPAELTEVYCMSEMKLKPLITYLLIKENNWQKFLCFTNSTKAANRLCFVLKKLFGDTMVINELSSQLLTKDRKNVLHRFATGKIHGLVTSDALARGIDVPNVDAVISYDMARHLKTYIHRVGRTARAGQHGRAITMLSPEEKNDFDTLIKLGGKKKLEEQEVLSEITDGDSVRYTEILKSLNKYLAHENKREMSRAIRKKHTAIVEKKLVNTENLNFVQQLQAKLLTARRKKAVLPTKKADEKTPKKKPARREGIWRLTHKNLSQ